MHYKYTISSFETFIDPRRDSYKSFRYNIQTDNTVVNSWQFVTPYQRAKTLQTTNSLILICGNNISQSLVTHQFCLSILRTMMVKSCHINTRSSLERHEKLRLIFIIVYIRKARFADDNCDNLYKREIPNNYLLTISIRRALAREKPSTGPFRHRFARSMNCHLIIILKFT
ncbi:hypothetical protein ACS0PU_009824 [Formica fusca]